MLSAIILLAAANLLDDPNLDPLDFVYKCLLPRAAAISFLSAALLLTRSITNVVWRNSMPRFGRKALLVSGSSFLFATSCVYRALNVADEGAFLCRSRPTVFNAPVSGRMVATIGELALVVQMTAYLDDTARSLGVARAFSTASPMSTLAPALVAETFSWLGVLTGISKFFCLEYCCWVFIATIWAWDAAELCHRSRRAADTLMHAIIVVVSLALVFFNLLHELPHFLHAVPLNGAGGSDAMVPASDEWVPTMSARPTPFSCTQHADSPIWLTRLPFFVTYFVGASMCSAILAARHQVRSA